MFTFWDRLFGTHVDLYPDDPPRLVTPGGVRTYDGANALVSPQGSQFTTLATIKNSGDWVEIGKTQGGWSPKWKVA